MAQSMRTGSPVLPVRFTKSAGFLAPIIDGPPLSTTLADLAEGGLRAASHSACIVVVEAARRGRGWLV